MTSRDLRQPSARGPRKRPRRESRRPVSAERFARLVIYLPPPDAFVPGAIPARRKRLLGALALLALSVATLAGFWGTREDAPVAKEELFVIEELPPTPETPPPTPPDPAPPKPEPQAIPEEPPPPPQFGMQQEALSEAGDMAVASGNTLMTQADTVVKAPVAELPPAPEFFDKPPRIRSAPDAEYPPRALEIGAQGVSRLRIEIDEKGRVTRVTVEKSGGKDFDKSAMAAARGTVFDPYTRGGKPVSAAFLKSYEFILE